MAISDLCFDNDDTSIEAIKLREVLEDIETLAEQLFTGVRADIETLETADELRELASKLACGIFDILEKSREALGE